MNDPYESPRGEGGRGRPDRKWAATLGVLDPASSDPAYWLRFHRAVLAAARSELDRRRMVSGVTVDQVLSSWGRTLVPAAMIMAAVAGLFLLQGGRTADPVESPLDVDVEMVLADGLEGAPIPTVVSSPEYPDAEGATLFASGTY